MFDVNDSILLIIFLQIRINSGRWWLTKIVTGAVLSSRLDRDFTSQGAR